MRMVNEDGVVCTKCKVYVYDEFEGADVTMCYRWEGNDRDGRDSLGEDATDWSDDEIREAVALTVGIAQGAELIQIIRM